MSRPSLDEYMMRLAEVAATRATCIRRSVGCVLADARGHVMSIAYNGPARGQPHCNEVVLKGRGFKDLGEGVSMPSRMVPTHPHACPGHDLPPGQDGCEGVHAESNCLIQCRDPFTMAACYVTLSPCKACVKLLLNTSCRRVVFREEWSDPTARELWLKAGREWARLPR